MPKFKVSEFAITYGYKESTVKSWVHRGQLQKDKKGFIDTDNDKNKLFLLQNQAKNTVKKVATFTPEKESEQKKEKEPQQKEFTPKNKHEKIALETEQAKLDKLKAETQVKIMQAQKMAGLLMPVELVENIISVHNKSIYNTFWGEIETLVNIVNPEREIATANLKKLRELYSSLVIRAKDEALEIINDIIDEFSMK